MVLNKAREDWAADPHVAAYVWEALSWSVEPVVISEIQPDGAETKLAALDGISVPFEFRAVPVRFGLPELTIEVPLGWKPVWEHRVTMAVPVAGGPKAQCGEALIFGVRADESFGYFYRGETRPFPSGGREKLATILWDGSMRGFSSLRAARRAVDAGFTESLANGSLLELRGGAELGADFKNGLPT